MFSVHFILSSKKITIKLSVTYSAINTNRSIVEILANKLKKTMKPIPIFR